MAGLGTQVGSQVGMTGGAPMQPGVDIPSQMATTYPLQGIGGPPQPMGVNLPSSVQRMPGGFGLSPQLLQQIAALQSRSPQFTPVAQSKPAFGGAGAKPAPNPYATNGWAPYGIGGWRP